MAKPTPNVSRLTIPALEAAVRRHNRLYFVEHRPEISDAEFDQLVELLKARKPDSPVLQEVGADVMPGERETVRHRVPMLSLDKCYSAEAAMEWAAKFAGDLIASPKIDGCAVSLHYDRAGALALAATRGNGLLGEAITANMRFVADIPQTIPLRDVEVRGEVYMPLSVFAAFAGAFANPRNLAAGAVKQKDPRKTAGYRLRFWAYDLLGLRVATEREKRERLERAGFPVVEWRLAPQERLQAVYEDFLARRDRYDFETDGVVFRVNEVAQQERVGSTIHHPRYAIAYKFQGDAGVTRLVEIVWSVSRTGTITPVGIVEPVQLSGATVTRVSLHHYGQLRKLGLAKGAKVLMMRRGGVIPNLESVVEAGREEIHAPARCPSCGAPVEQRDDFLYCTDARHCVTATLGALKHFMRVIDCEGFGDKLIAKCIAAGLLTDPADFYTLEAEQLVALERMGETLADKLIGRIRERRALPLDVFLRALGIPGLAKRTSQLLAGHFRTLERVRAATEEALNGLHGIGEVLAREVVAGLKAKRRLIERLLAHVTVTSAAAGRKAASGPLAGKSVLFTGTLLAMERKHAQSLVLQAGGSNASGVSSHLDFLVVGAGGGAGSKLGKAKALVDQGTALRILTEKEFLKLLKLPA
ncbi:MAG: NAD-dependent DNA ligase LigA [Deltaproteobacteria bacterium]|nr:NAD-dependent DNA ligase LigA [Deltaproteobacteria bacterium]